MIVDIIDRCLVAPSFLEARSLCVQVMMVTVGRECSLSVQYDIEINLLAGRLFKLRHGSGSWQATKLHPGLIAQVRPQRIS